MSNQIDELKKLFPDISFHANYDLTPKTYFKIGGPAEIFTELSNHHQIEALVAACKKLGIKITILGAASNVLVDDHGVSGLVLKISDQGIETLETGKKSAQIYAGAGAITAVLVKKTVDQSLTGLEYFLGVPGTVGGAIYNNSHYLNDLIGNYIEAVKVINQKGKITWLKQSECDFAYDHSRFQTSKEVILGAKFSLLKGDPQAIREKMLTGAQYRAKSQPLGEPSSGCIFQNVPNNEKLTKLFPQFANNSHISAGFLIDHAGLKGAKVGDIMVSHKHAAFMVNTNQGTASQVKELIVKVKQTIKEKFGVELKTEVFFLE